MNKCIIAGFVLILSFTMVSCKVWIKRGAGPEQLSRDQSACSTQADGHHSGEAYFECMRDLGWYHQDRMLESSGSDATKWPESLLVHPGPTEQSQPTADENDPPDERSDSESTPGETLHQGEYKVGSWWKIGGSPEQLKQDQDECRSEPESDDESSVLLWTTKPEFVHCMKDKGWHGFSE